MAQDVHVIDIRRPYRPIDPNQFQPSYHDTQGEDNPEPRIPVVPYAGHNFMPTYEGYASYFGINAALEIDTLVASGGSGNVDDLFMIQTHDFRNILVALCDDGLWTKSSSTTGAWTQEQELTPPDAGLHLLWSKCVIENEIFCYRQGNTEVFRARAASNFIFEGFTPTTINMAGQLGIFKAGGRLGFWDSENSTAWAELGNPENATPSQETLAGATIFQDIVGRIVVIHQHGDGFIIYCTKSIVLVERNLGAPLIWKGRSIFNNNGISYREECCFGEPDSQHYAFTTQGIVEISRGDAKFVIPEVATYLREKKQPVYFKMLNGRFLFMTLLDPSYFTGLFRVISEDFPAITQTFKGATYSIEHPDENGCKAINAAQNQHEGIYLLGTFGYTGISQAVNVGDVPIWEDNLAINIPIAVMEDYKATGVSGMGSIDYFMNGSFTQGTIAKIDGSGNEAFIPAFGPGLISDYESTWPINHEEENTQNFYSKQDLYWVYEQRLFDHWKEAIQRKTHDSYSENNGTVFEDNVPYFTRTPHTFGPYIDLSFFSESNKYYGIADKSAWLQRSLTRAVSIHVVETLAYTVDIDHEGIWRHNSGGIPPPVIPQDALYSELISLGAMVALFNSVDPEGPVTYVGVELEETVTAYTYHMHAIQGELPPILISIVYTAIEAAGQKTWIGPYYVGTGTITQTFSQPEFRYQFYDPCTYKNLGYTEIVGHGHYTLAGAFVVDDATPEATDYVDQCDTPPAPTLTVIFNGTPIGVTPIPCGLPDVEIDDETYTYPDEEVTIPGGTILLQDGSIEPVYPTFLGAFVFDTQYKKWGKMKQSFKQLLDLFPINHVSGNAPIPYETFLPKMAGLLEDGSIALFDAYPSDSQITFGKYGVYRKGFTDMEEVRIQNRNPLTGAITVDGSLDGKNVEIAISQTKAFTNATQAVAGFSLSARWYNITVSGNYDLINVEARSSRKGKR